MAIPRKKILQKIDGLRKPIQYHLDVHIPNTIGEADHGLIEYWRKEVSRLIADMKNWAARLSNNDQIMVEAAQYQRKLNVLLDECLRELDS